MAISNLVDDSGQGRQPSHSHIGEVIERAGLASADPLRRGETIGKAKRVRAVLSFALRSDSGTGGRLAASLISVVRGHGGFRPDSPNYVGKDVIADLIAALQTENVGFSPDGIIAVRTLDNLEGRALTDALLAYVRRAKQGVDDAALLVGTGKDLVEATAKHVLAERMHVRPKQIEAMDFPTLLSQAFYALGLATPKGDPPAPGEHPRRHVERALYDTACAVNKLRSKEGTGHGRPWPVGVGDDEARTAVELMGVVAGRMLDVLHAKA